MQLVINNANIGTLDVKVNFDIYSRSVIFDTSATTYNGSGQSLIQGISFSLIDEAGIILAVLDFTDAANYIVPSVTETKTIDLSSLPYQFLFQTYQIIAAIRDQDGTIYTTTPVYKKVCQPIDITDSGYVPGLFQISTDCTSNTITIKELTLLVYNNQAPTTTVKDGTLSYPTGTIAAIDFTGTPFTNDEIYTGQYRINCETIATYDLGDDVFVDVTYITNNAFNVTCANKMGDLMCCLVDLQNTYLKNCTTAVGKNAQQKLYEISIPLMIGIGKEINGQDASAEAAIIKKALSCDCGSKSLGQNEMTPINPAVTNIVLQGVGGTSIGAPTVTGNTKTYNIASNAYQVVKGDAGDLAFSITIGTATPYTVKYKITFNYATMADYILTEFENSSTYIQRLNDLITSSGLNLQGLDGKCVIDLSQADYVVSQSGLSGSTFLVNIVINGNTYNAPGTLFATNTVGIQNWLNSLTLGTFSAVYSSGILTIISTANTNIVATLTIDTPDLTIAFQSTNKTLVQILQAIIDYLCGLTTLQVALNAQLSLCLFDYNGNIISYTYNAGQPQSDYNLGISQAICNIVARINTLTAITCAKIQAVFPDSPLSVVGPSDRFYASVGGSCAGLTYVQVANAVIAAINANSATKAAFCAIDCTVPGTCPDIASINGSIVGSDIAIYGVGYTGTTTASQTATVRYRLNGNITWLVATNSLLLLANGNVASSPPYLITGLIAGQTYDVQIVNNCGGNGFITQITVPTSPVFSAQFLLDAIIYNVCGNSAITLYSSSPFASGVTMYSDIGLTTPVTGYNYIVQVTTNQIYQINSSTGVVGVNTGSLCNSAITGSYILGNNTGTICANSPEALYTSVPFAVGVIVYTDSALTTPVTGSSYIVDTSTNIIYNLNTSTGQVGASTGLACSSTNVYAQNQLSGTIITGVSSSNFIIGSSINFGDTGTATHTAFTGTIEVDIGATGGPVSGRLSLYVNGVLVQCINTITGDAPVFNSLSYSNSDVIAIVLQPGTC